MIPHLEWSLIAADLTKYLPDLVRLGWGMPPGESGAARQRADLPMVLLITI
ncbi:MAG TPA: hypothetical protein V6D37_09125 [Candidatus Sericytochromatia bacterium]